MDSIAATTAVSKLLSRGLKRFGILARAALPGIVLPDEAVVLLPGPDYPVQDWAPRRVLAQVTTLEEADRALRAGAAGLIAKGAESGGRVGDEAAFILFQRLYKEYEAPIWVQGGVGVHTAAACAVGGAAGVVVDAQLALVRESRLPGAVKDVIGQMDGSETVVVGGHRVFLRADLDEALRVDPAIVAERLGVEDLTTQLLPCGQDAALAGLLARRFVTAGGVACALTKSMDAAAVGARAQRPLTPGNALAQFHGIRYPVLQGPMTRVSDTAQFAEAVAEAGALPFIALSLLRGATMRRLLEETKVQLGERAWGVGILGFVDNEVRAEQMAAIEAVRPPVALIAGGRPSQARALEDKGIATYLHVPSPGLLKLFLADGARRFIFEGRECGGHVGPRTSFALWELQLDELMRFPRPEELFVVFAGGIHDTRSAAMVSAMAAPLAARGAKVAVLMGTAYLFTQEAVAAGAILPAYQRAALECTRTVLLETAPGHATRCIESPYVSAFVSERTRLEAEGRERKEIWAQLEQLNLGRLRIAAKGVRREGRELRQVDDDEQQREGMYMIGDVAMMHGEVISAEALHRQVTVEVDDYLAALPGPLAKESPRPVDIAIVGMAGVFPGAEDVETFWSNVVNGILAFSEVDPARWNPDVYYDPDSRNGDKTPTKWGGFLGDILFNPVNYGIPPQSLAAVDPAQLLSLEVARQALEDAGYWEREFDRSRASVIFGAESGADISLAYGFRALYPQLAGELPAVLDEHLPRLTEDSFPGVLSNLIAGRIANRFDFGGINLTVDAACASSLAALDAAIKELILGGSDMVLCGGADLHNGINDYLMFAGVHALSRGDVCRTFDSQADGTVLGEGVACVVLKRLADAERDGDRIYAVIRSIAGSSDGRSLGLTAPRREGQVSAVRRAYERGGMSPREIGLVEAHGTGTVVGDRTELAVLTEIFAEDGVQSAQCALGSVKSQIGHTKCTAGLASLIKTSKALYHRILPPTLNIENPNPGYDPTTSPFALCGHARPWVEKARHAAVSAFGFGGSNFHALLCAYDDGEEPSAVLAHWAHELFVLRGENAEVARGRAREMLALLAAGHAVKLRDLAATLALGTDGPVRFAFVAGSLDELRVRLEDIVAGRSAEGQLFAAHPVTGKVALLFPGQGSQRPNMLRDLFVTFRGLNGLLEMAAEWRESLFPPTAWTPEQRTKQQVQMTDTRVAQPTLGLVSLALESLLDQAGLVAEMAAGHSYGELVALCVAGCYSSEALLALSRERAEAILAAAGDEDPGGMAAVAGQRDAIRAALEGIGGIVEANQNAPLQTVISGPTKALEQALAHLEAAGIAAKGLPVAAAFHSPIVADAADRLRDYLSGMDIDAPRFQVWSNVTAEPYLEEPERIRAQLAEQVARPVRFVDEIEGMYEQGARIFVEVGPGQVLTGLVGRILGEREHVRIACDQDRDSGLRGLLTTLAQLSCLGMDLSYDFLFEGRQARQLDLSDPNSLAPPATAWKVNGWLARPTTGEPPKNRLRPTPEPFQLAPTAVSPPAGDEAALLTYLQNLRELAAAQRDVMLGYLGTNSGVAAASGFVAAEATPSATAVIATPVAESPAAAPSRPPLAETLLGIVSEKTGYPRDMLDLDQDLEAELSIDSIKRVEILGALSEQLDLSQSVGADRDYVIEQLAAQKTLRAIVAWLEERDTSLAGADAAAAGGGADTASFDLEQELLKLVSEKTGYPQEMLGLDQDLEADLSIDSIKRVEILGALAERLDLSSRAVGEDREHMIEQLAARKTLGEILNWLRQNVTGETHEPSGSHSVAAGTAEETEAANSAAIEVRRFVPVSSGIAAPKGDFSTLAGKRFFVTDTRHLIAARIKELLEGSGAAVEDGAAAAAFSAKIDGVLFLGGLREPNGLDPVKELFDLSKVAVRQGIGSLYAVTSLGGRFSDEDATSLMGVGVAGLIKSLAKEHPEMRVGVIDVAPQDDAREVARFVLEELTAAERPMEVGYAAGQRYTQEMAQKEIPEGCADGLPLDEHSVVLVTGGARGITAAVSAALAQRTRCRMVLVGRSPLPGPEDPQLASAKDFPSLRRLLIRAGELKDPKSIEAECRRVMAEREVRATLHAIAAAGAPYEYHSLDVRDSEAFDRLIDDLYARFGRIDGAIHGAGIIEDKLLRDKSRESFDRVFDTKVIAAQSLAERLRADVKFVAFFSSVSGAFGNRGQSDYAAAGDVLDKLAKALQQRISGRVVSIDWGPWASTGMVSEALAAEYARRGIGLIPLQEGVECFLREISCRNSREPQIVLMAADPASMSA
ncbi:type I polyketide synthase [Thioflavicoccus mobilis]|uniref:type I polyketide synthase n=1 Tax=Thioflavicoccus mobilis TaxID=80679 RepID=UPI0006886005|nr:type I polyketide synthase [Thioflavicoccus mobilis]